MSWWAIIMRALELFRALVDKLGIKPNTPQEPVRKNKYGKPIKRKPSPKKTMTMRDD